MSVIIKKVNQTKIPLIIIDSRLDQNEVKKNKLDFSFIGFDDYSAGFDTGKLFTKHFLKNDPVAILQGYKVGSYSKRVDGFRKAITNHLQLEAVVSANFEELKSYQETKKLFKRLPHLKGIFCTSDNMAMGTLTALYELNRNDVWVSGFDGTHAGRLALQKGRLLSTVSTQPEEMGRKAIIMARDQVLNSTKPSEQIIPTYLLTQSSVLDLPKQIIQKHHYIIVRPKKDLSEFDYPSIASSTDCPIILGNNFKKDLPPRLRLLSADKYIIITDQVVHRLYGKQFLQTMKHENLETKLFVIPSGEQYKTFTTLNDLATRILASGITKKSCLILLGGGVIGNLAGFLAAILMRGIRFVHVPTTVMSQIDSTTGGKQAVNTEHGKNLLGTFYEPQFIYIDFSFIKTLPKREFNSGMAEAIKHGLCQSKKLLKLIDNNIYPDIVREVIALKIQLIESDPREKKEGLALVYGHTIGHALETASAHQLNHGEAISIGMVAAVHISNAMHFCNKELVSLHENILKKHGLPIRIPKNIKKEKIFQALLFDKKERNRLLPFVLLEKMEKMKNINETYLIPVKKEVIMDVIDHLFL